MKATYLIKSTLLVCCFIINLGFAFSQNNTVNAYNYLKQNDLVNAKAAIDLAVYDTVKSNRADAWFIRGEVYFAIYHSTDESDKALHKSPLQEALHAYMQTLKVDHKKKHNANIIKRLKVVSMIFFNEGVTKFNNKVYEEALESFENSIMINEMPMILKVDTTLFFNAAKAAEKSGKYDKSVKYHLRLLDLNYDGAVSYQGLASVYLAKGDITNFKKVILDGIAFFPNDNMQLMMMLINYYLTSNMFEEAEEQLKLAIEKDPLHAPFHYILGSIYERKDEIDKAEECYKKAIEAQHDHFEANYNLGVIYYNKAARQIEIINGIKDRTEYDKAKLLVDEYFSKSMEYYESAEKVKPEDEEIKKTLEFLRNRLKKKEEGQ